MSTCDIKHLMTDTKGNSEFCFPETSMFPEAKPRCFVIPPDLKVAKSCGKKDLLDAYDGLPTVRAAVKPSCPTETTR